MIEFSYFVAVIDARIGKLLSHRYDIGFRKLLTTDDNYYSYLLVNYTVCVCVCMCV